MLNVQKFSGELIEFDENKLRKSMLKSGAEALHVEEILAEIMPILYDGIPTKKIYRIAFNLLKRKSNALAARYHLKKSLQELGPDGFLFEQFLAQVFLRKGYQVYTNRFLQGACLTHETDLILIKNNQNTLVECKFSSYDKVMDVKIPMYILSRFNDLEAVTQKIDAHTFQFHACWLITNNRFSKDAEIFGTYYGIKLFSWNYPQGNSLKNWIDEGKFYPITTLTTITKDEKFLLLQQNILLVHQLRENQESLKLLNLSINRNRKVLQEIHELCYLKLE
ncbi:MAG: hypothetical protein KGZ81_14145 [Flavobacteriales bacterium]|nr:hypothetical protein [Flavobacteriales bacterium]